MAKVIIVGDGPAGLSAALFLAKNDQEVIVYGGDETALHYAHLYNYLGLPDIGGSEFAGVARAQVVAHGASLREGAVTELARADDGFRVGLEDGREERAAYVVLAAGKAGQRLAAGAGAEVRDGAVVVDAEQRTTVDGLYAAGRVVRTARSQAVISAGAGAVAALDILSTLTRRDIADWDTPPDG